MGQRKKERWLRKTMVDISDGTDDRKRFTVCDSYTVDASFFTHEIAMCSRHRETSRRGVFFYTAGCPRVLPLSLFTRLQNVGANRKGTFVLQIVSRK